MKNIVSKWGFRIYCAIVLSISLFASATAFAGDPVGVVSNLSNFVFQLIKAIGIIMLAFGIVQFGLSLKSHDPSQRANSFLTIAGGIVVTFTKEILTIIQGG